MANIYTNAKVDLTTTNATTLYTAPSNSRSLVKAIHVYNEGAGDAVVTIKIT